MIDKRECLSLKFRAGAANSGRLLLPYQQLNAGCRLSARSICLKGLHVLTLMGRAIRLLCLVEEKEVIAQDIINRKMSTPSCNCQGTNYKPV